MTEAADGRVSAISPATGKRRLIRADMRQPEGITELDDGRLVVAEVGAKRIVAITTDTGEIEVIADDLPLSLPPFMEPPKTFLPTGVLVGDGGIIYVAADVTHTVLKISPLH